MINELIFIIIVFLDLFLVLFSFKFGKAGIIGTIVLNLILVSTFGAKLINIFGFTTNCANAFYASTFLAINILVEHYGKKTGLQAMWIGFVSIFAFMLMSQLVVHSVGISNSEQVDVAISTLFKIAPRIAFASIFSYLIAQNLNIYIFDYLQKRWQKKRLWLRNITSTSMSQVVDSFIFFSLAFYGVISNQVLFQSIVVGIILKTLIAVFSCPVLSASAHFVSDEESMIAEIAGSNAKRLESNYVVYGSKVKFFVVDAICLVVIVVAILVLGGWIFNIPILTTLIPNSMASMKISTAISFIFSALIVYFISQNLRNKKDMASIMLPVCTLIIILFMVTMLVYVIFGVNTGIEELFIRSSKVRNNVINIPSLFTMINFVLISIASIITLYGPKYLGLMLRFVGMIIFTISLVAIIGHILRIPQMYYLIGNISNGMAIHTAILFVLIGFSLNLLVSDRFRK